MRELRLNRRNSETELSVLLRSKNYSVHYTELPFFLFLRVRQHGTVSRCTDVSLASMAMKNSELSGMSSPLQSSLLNIESY